MLIRGLARSMVIAISSLLTLVTVALIPGPAAAALLLLLLLTVVMTWSTAGERLVVRLLAGAREMTEAERCVFAPVAMDLKSRGVDLGETHVRRPARRGTPAYELLAMHAVGARDGVAKRGELVFLVLTTPWRTVMALGRGVSRPLRWMPLAGAAWAMRGILGLVCLYLRFTQGPRSPRQSAAPCASAVRRS